MSCSCGYIFIVVPTTCMDFWQPIYRRCVFPRVMQNCHSQTDTVLILASGKALAISTADISSHAVLLLIHTDYIRFSRYINIALFWRHNECQVKKIVVFTSSMNRLLTIIVTQGIIDLIIVSNVIREVRTHDWCLAGELLVVTNRLRYFFYRPNISIIHYIFWIVNIIFIW